MESESSLQHRKELYQYYHQRDTSDLDINSKSFDSNVYVQKVLKENSLKQLLDQEASLVTEIQRLDSDCQSLVYDHYDKFIAASDIVQKMKDGSVTMESEVTNLQEIVSTITKSSNNITAALQDSRKKLNGLLGVHGTLKKLEFLFQLPQKIEESITAKEFKECVQYYLEMQEILERYRHLQSFSALYNDCQSAVFDLKNALKVQLSSSEVSMKDLVECVGLLLELGEPSEALCSEFLSHSTMRLQNDLDHLSQLVVESVAKESLLEESKASNPDVLEFVDVCNDTFVGNLWLTISSYKEMFLRSPEGSKLVPDDPLRRSDALGKLEHFVVSMVESYIAVILERLLIDSSRFHVPQLATALDKVHRRMLAISQLIAKHDFERLSLDLIMKVSKKVCSLSLEQLKHNLNSTLWDIRKEIISPRQVLQDGASSPHMYLNELLTKLVSSVAADIQEKMLSLLVFIQPRYTFAVQDEFRKKFCKVFVREEVIVAFFSHIRTLMLEYCSMTDKDPALILLLSRMCLDLNTSTIHYLLSHCDEQLQLDDKKGLTPLSEITHSMKEAGQELLNHFVHIRGSSISMMLRRSLELKNWLTCGEPRSVRRVMRTIREEITTIDAQVGALYEEGSRKDRSSDSSRRTLHSSSLSRGLGTRSGMWPAYPSTQLDNTLAANLSKLWSEKIEIFTSIEFTKLSILTGIIKISLKTLLECVRLHTLGQFGLQQMQVDTFYLRTYLWPYIADEQVLNALLDEVMTSAALRCTNPKFMEYKVVEFICEQN